MQVHGIREVSAYMHIEHSEKRHHESIEGARMWSVPESLFFRDSRMQEELTQSSLYDMIHRIELGNQK